MSTDLMPFTYEGQSVRTVVIDGEPWFVLADLCAVLDIANPRNVSGRLSDDQKGVRLMDTPGGQQNLVIVNEAGMYEVVIRSDKPEAIAFRRWLTGTVLPQIRKTGSFGGTPALPDITTAAGVLAMAEQFATTARALVASEQRVAELEPKAELADSYLSADGGDRLIAQVAKLLGHKEKNLRRFLIEDRLLFVRHSKCGTPQYEPYSEFVEHFTVHEVVVNHTWGACSHFTLRARPRGVDLIRRRLAKAGLVSIVGQAS